MFAIFVMALAGGVGVGVVLARHNWLKTASPAAAADRSSLAEELQLSPEQSEQMRRIWEGARERSKTYYDEVKKLQKGRDDEMVALLNVEQKARFEKIAHDYADRFSEAVSRREAVFDDAVQQTRKLLNTGQRERYEQILRSRVGSLTPPPSRDLFPTGSWKSGDSGK